MVCRSHLPVFMGLALAGQGYRQAYPAAMGSAYRSAPLYGTAGAELERLAAVRAERTSVVGSVDRLLYNPVSAASEPRYTTSYRAARPYASRSLEAAVSSVRVGEQMVIGPKQESLEVISLDAPGRMPELPVDPERSIAAIQKNPEPEFRRKQEDLARRILEELQRTSAEEMEVM